MSTRVGQLQVSLSSRGHRTYRLELWHPELRKHRIIKGNDAQLVERKARLQLEDWEQRWQLTMVRDAQRQGREERKAYQESQKELAALRAEEATALLRTIEKTLEHTLSIDDTISWDDLKDRSPYAVPKPSDPVPEEVERPEPRPTDAEFAPSLGILDRVFSSRSDRKRLEMQQRFQTAHQEWATLVEDVAQRNEDAQKAHEAEVAVWEGRRAAFMEAQEDANRAVDQQRDRYYVADPAAILDYCDLVLSNSEYPDFMPKEFELDYVVDTKTLVIEYALPSVEAVPTLCDVRYVQSRDDLVEKHLSEAQQLKLYDGLVYQVALRSVHEIFEADVIQAMDAVVFNGRVTSIDHGTGHETTACVLSLHVQRDDFLAINLGQVDPKACFRALKGVGSSKLHSLTPIAPILQLRREDGRFVSAREVANTLDDSVNLAAMPWEDFEHLVRELFESEFAAAGGEVKITQASRDGGVDAMVFDPDPIRGGKIIIQAKRYTNTVAVAAVRDLYGTVMNEGANKGILVTTSDYGPDAYAFAKDKPLTLLNGANLLHMLQKHGRLAHIDIKTARELSR